MQSVTPVNSIPIELGNSRSNDTAEFNRPSFSTGLGFQSKAEECALHQPRSADPVTVPVTSTDPVTVPELATVPDPATVPDTATTDQAVHDNFSGEVACSAHDQLTPKPPDTQHVKFKETVAELAVNKSLSKSALKKKTDRKQQLQQTEQLEQSMIWTLALNLQTTDGSCSTTTK
ncbi:hypothetical protein RHGRI_020857 [Rhododendron griersonianum]|uniref:Uncharacterized protein n=1 Tax=Rhododendron griersonianum TaxID=479676 RepID=A0AAV6JQB8_9ERIC|nr:hypothetical protein RHGRI_020857 [Rhododendron griersonianum]